MKKGHETVRISDVAITFAGGTPDRSEKRFFGGDIPWVKSGEVAGASITTTEETLTPEGLANSAAKWCEPGATLVAMYGATAGQVGRLAIRATTNQAVLCVQARNAEDADFLYYAIQASIRRLIRKAQGSGQPNLNAGMIRDLEIPWPDISIRRSVSGAFGLLDRMLLGIDKLIAAKREFKRGLMQELLTGRRRFPEFVTADPWVKVRLGDIVAPVQRPVAWDDHAQYRLVSIRRRNGGLFLREVVRGADIKTKKLFTVRTGDLVLSRMQVVHGAVAVVPPEFDGAHVSGMYMVLRPQQPVRVRTEFLHYLFHLPHMYQLVLRCCYGVHIEKMTFNPDRFFRSRVLIPQTIDEQDRITAVLRWLDQEIDTLVRLHAAHREQQRGLMQKLLTGELTIPVSSEPEPVHA